MIQNQSNNEAVSENQRKRAVGGRLLENNVTQIIRRVLEKEDIHAFSVRDVKHIAKSSSEIQKALDFTRIPIANPCHQQIAMDLPDTDVMILLKQVQKPLESKWVLMGIISCKQSFHGRETESAFWSSLIRPRGIEYVLVTEDKDRYGQKNKSELGSCSKDSSKLRRLLEYSMDRVYIIKKYSEKGYNALADIDAFAEKFEKSKSRGFRPPDPDMNIIFDDHKRKPHAGHCNMVRPFDDLLFDIMQWKFSRI